MLRPLTEPSTPLRRVRRIDGDYANYSAPSRTRVSAIHLPPQELPEILHKMSLRRPSSGRQIVSPVPLRSLYLPSDTPQTRSNAPFRRHTPTRRLSDHLTIRRSRRSSTGAVYDSAFAESVNQEFLLLISKTLVQEKKHLVEEPDDQVFKALDKRHWISSTSPQGAARDFDLSLPLPSEDEMQSSESDQPVLREEATPVVPERKQHSKPPFKSYLERILTSRSRKSLRVLDLAYDKESSEEAERQERLKSSISTSKFIIENTLSGLPESWNKEDQASDLKLAEPVTFGTLYDNVSSNDSSEKETAHPIGDAFVRSARLPQIGLGNRTPENYHDVHFDNIDQLDVPCWNPVPIYNESDALGSDLGDANIAEPKDAQAQNDIVVEDAAMVSSLNSELLQSGLILCHFTVDNDDIIADEDTSFVHLPDNHDARSFLPPSASPGKSRATVVRRPFTQTLDLPKHLLKGCVAAAQRLPTTELGDSPPRKRQKVSRINTDIVNLISQKSGEFLLQVMSDLDAYAEHRNSDKIDISDALLYINRIKARHELLGQDVEFPVLAQNLFPLELLMALDNSLQQSAKKIARKAYLKTDSENLEEGLEESSYLEGGEASTT